MPWQLDLMTFGEIDEYLGQMNDVVKSGENAEKQRAVEAQHNDQRERLRLGPKPTFKHRR